MPDVHKPVARKLGHFSDAADGGSEVGEGPNPGPLFCNTKYFAGKWPKQKPDVRFQKMAGRLRNPGYNINLQWFQTADCDHVLTQQDTNTIADRCHLIPCHDSSKPARPVLKRCPYVWPSSNCF